MGNSSSKDSHPPSRSVRQHSSGPQHVPPPPQQQHPSDRLPTHLYYSRNHPARSSRADLSFLHIGPRERDHDHPPPERPRETKQERDARRAERERQNRLKERERSMREEHVDGGYLVTLGTYTGPEDFSKPVVRQLQVERRLAPFWKGLNDHSESWTEAQLVAAARDLPIPAADEVPPEMARTGSQGSPDPQTSDTNANHLTVPITSRSHSFHSDGTTNLSASHPAFSTTGPASSSSAISNSAQLIRGRAKTLASLATGSKNQSPDLTPQEVRLPHDPFINGQRIEAYLYKDASECPICFLYYPPYLNKTRCCDQPICSECFVQIKRPDPHPPEHEQPGEPRPPEEEAEMLVSEVASCPFCVSPEFGVTYEPPPFRRGLSYAHQHNTLLKASNSPAGSSTTSLTSGAGRRRATSLSATAPNVITTDRVRPDWAKKLADARAHALRRSAAATALHNAAYVLGNQGDAALRAGFGLGRRRRTFFSESPGGSGAVSPREGDAGNDLYTGRRPSRRNQAQDIEDLMIAEAIRLSLAAEEDRKRREEKEAQKEAKKKAKEARKEEKRASKIAKRTGSSGSLYRAGTNDSSSTWGSTSMARSTSNLGVQESIPEEQIQGKGKEPMQTGPDINGLLQTVRDRTSSSPSPPPTSPMAKEDPQRHLAESRANLHPAPSAPIPTPGPRASHFRQLSNASSAASSFIDSPPGSYRGDSNFHSATDLTSGSAHDSSGHHLSSTPNPNSSTEPMLNFRSLAAMIDQEEGKLRDSDHIEHAPEQASRAEEELKEPSPKGSPHMAPTSVLEGNRARGNSGESSSSSPPPPSYAMHHPESPPSAIKDADEITPVPTAPQVRLVHDDPDQKDMGRVGVDALDREHVHEATQ